MDRWLLNNVPTAALVVLAIAVPVAVGVGGFTLMRRLVPSLERHADSRSLSSAFGISASLFSFVLAFTIGQLYGNFTAAKAHAKTEATAVEQILRVSHGLSPRLGAAVRRETLAYASDVRTVEWKRMEHGHDSLAAWQDVDRIYAILEAARSTAGTNSFYGETVSRVDDLVTARQARLDDANLSIPNLFKALLLAGALLAIFGTFYFKPFGERIQVVMIGAAAALVGLALLVAVTLDYPYSGSVAVSNAPFAPQTLLVLSGG